MDFDFAQLAANTAGNNSIEDIGKQSLMSTVPTPTPLSEAEIRSNINNKQTQENIWSPMNPTERDALPGQQPNSFVDAGKAPYEPNAEPTATLQGDAAQPEQSNNVYPSDIAAQQAAAAAEQKAAQDKQVSDALKPLDDKIKAQQQYQGAIGVFDKERSKALKAQESADNEKIKQFNDIKAEYEVSSKTRMAAIDDQLKQVETDALTARKGTSDLFAEKSTGQKVAAGIAMLLGAAGGVLGNGQNRGLETVMGALQDERANNLKNFAMSKDMLELKRKNMDDYTKAITERTAMVDKQALLQLQLVQTKLQQAAGTFQTAGANLGVKDAMATLEMQKQSLKQQLVQQQTMQDILKNTDALSGMSNAQIEMLPLPPEVKKGLMADRELRVPGYVGVAQNKSDRDEFQKARQEIVPAIAGAKRILSLQGKDFSKFSPEDRAKMGTEIKALAGQLRLPFLGPGQMTEQEFDRLMSTIGDPNKILSLPSLEKAKLTTVLNKLDTDIKSRAKNIGLKPATDNSDAFHASPLDFLAEKYLPKRK
jgi:hypothetical protein